MTLYIHHKHAYKRTHILKVCGPSLIDQNNVAAVTFSPGTDQLYIYIGVSLLLMCRSLLLFGPGALLLCVALTKKTQ